MKQLSHKHHPYFVIYLSSTYMLCAFIVYGKETWSFRSRAFEVRWCNHWTMSLSFSRCLNWLMLCQLWNEVWLQFNMWLLLLWHSASIPHPGMRHNWKLRRNERVAIARFCRLPVVCMFVFILLCDFQILVLYHHCDDLLAHPHPSVCRERQD